MTKSPERLNSSSESLGAKAAEGYRARLICSKCRLWSPEGPLTCSIRDRMIKSPKRLSSSSESLSGADNAEGYRDRLTCSKSRLWSPPTTLCLSPHRKAVTACLS